jgi:hypothetical protein
MSRRGGRLVVATTAPARLRPPPAVLPLPWPDPGSRGPDLLPPHPLRGSLPLVVLSSIAAGWLPDPNPSQGCLDLAPLRSLVGVVVVIVSGGR